MLREKQKGQFFWIASANSCKRYGSAPRVFRRYPWQWTLMARKEKRTTYSNRMRCGGRGWRGSGSAKRPRSVISISSYLTWILLRIPWKWKIVPSEIFLLVFLEQLRYSSCVLSTVFAYPWMFGAVAWPRLWCLFYLDREVVTYCLLGWQTIIKEDGG